MNVLRCHYPEYLMEAVGLGIFMISASVVTAALEHPASLVHQAVTNPLLRRLIIGVAMGLTAIAIIYSPWGKQSGVHINPVVTLTFFLHHLRGSSIRYEYESSSYISIGNSGS